MHENLCSASDISPQSPTLIENYYYQLVYFNYVKYFAIAHISCSSFNPFTG